MQLGLHLRPVDFRQCEHRTARPPQRENRQYDRHGDEAFGLYGHEEAAEHLAEEDAGSMVQGDPHGVERAVELAPHEDGYAEANACDGKADMLYEHKRQRE